MNFAIWSMEFQRSIPMILFECGKIILL